MIEFPGLPPTLRSVSDANLDDIVQRLMTRTSHQVSINAWRQKSRFCGGSLPSKRAGLRTSQPTRKRDDRSDDPAA